MAKVTISTNKITGVGERWPDYNRVVENTQYAGDYWKDNNARHYRTSGLQTIMFFKLPDYIKGKNYIRIDKITVRAKKTSSHYLDVSSSPWDWPPKTYNGMQAGWGLWISNDNDYTNSLTWNNANSLLGKNGGYEITNSYEASLVNVSTCATGAYFSCSKTFNDLYASDSEFNKNYAVIRFTGNRIGNMIYFGELYNQTTYLDIEYTDLRPVVTLDEVSQNINNAGTLSMSWKYSDSNNSKQTKATIKWSSNNGSSWNTVTVNGDATNYTFPGYTFPAGKILLKVSATNASGYTSAEVQTSFNSYVQPTTTTVVYPNNVNVRSDRDTIFTWYFSEEIPTGQAEYVLQWSYDQSNWHEVTEVTSNQFYTFRSGTFATQKVYWRVKARNGYGTWSGWANGSFNVVGTSEAPNITNVTNNAMPLVEWTCNNQAAWELIVKDSNEIIYQTGFVVGGEKSHQITKMLPNGNYSIEIRALNSFGYYTEWASYGLVLNALAPSAPYDLFVSAGNDYGISVNCTAPEDAGTLYVVRRQRATDEVVILGEYYDGFVDYSIPLNVPHQYSVRNYNVGYTDAEFLDGTVNADGIVIRDGENPNKFIHIWKHEDNMFNLIVKNSKSDMLIQTIGRRYPVKELGEWVTATRSISAFVEIEDYGTLVDMDENSKFVYLQRHGERIPCDMEVTDQGEYVGGGRFINFVFTRIDGD